MSMRNHIHKKAFYRQTGLTLVEIMVAITLSLVILAGVIEMFVATKQTYRVEEGLSRVQENARYAMTTIAKDIRMAGYAGCTSDINNLLDEGHPSYDPSLFDMSQAITAWEYTSGGGTAPGDTYTVSTLSPTGRALTEWESRVLVGSPGTLTTRNLASSLQNLVVPGTDVIVVKYAGGNSGVRPTGKTPANAGAIPVNGASNIASGTIIMITDCSGSDVFQTIPNPNANTLVFSNSGTLSPGNKNPGAYDFSHSYKESADILVFRSYAYYIGEGSNGRPALFRGVYTTGAIAASEIVEDVENLQILYGEDTGADDIPDKYVTAASVTDPTKISAVRISMVVSTPENTRMNSESKSLTLPGMGGTIITSLNDRKYRYVFSKTIKIRNKGKL